MYNFNEFCNESVTDTDIKLVSRQNREINLTVKNGRITSIKNDSGVNFPYVVNQPYNMGMKTWACNNGFTWNGTDPCPEKKIFGVKVKDVPQGHEWRKIFPNKFK